ncbi:hypothetical protein SELMODRAFT_140975 [Selaginella moellendorffii]|uniref:Alpha N-terminal protein methyltransferase 1 n=1 Tax=Selaginella moellendorffii TaxID=88036 RepID=D8QTA5_SELML|nr:alpha N-terminal protein methyltransferase 1 [Selaginella moellendorffii]EFJ37080.1 hypothetical protein SELMODRAFT_140975 [Selaginella moellendorffii]|eukprot:XP_002961820.1 alpha N-terminal protein methyltransferase 1 [Selaginella moellendorffii]
MDEGGLDSNGKVYASREDMWKEEAGSGIAESPKRKEWYQKGISYWEGVDPTVDGVLGGFGKVSNRDVIDSNAFLTELLKERILPTKVNRKLVALDCGAGVGRITENLLLRHFHEVDLVEPVRHFLDAAKKRLTSDVPENVQHKAVNFFCTPLQEFTPEPHRYDVIWVQWCIGHLTDDDFVAFFRRADIGLKPGGFFVLKENIARHGFVVDKLDSSVTRSDAYFRDLFLRAGFHLLKTKLQKGFPRELFGVRMYALSSVLQETAAPSSASKDARASKGVARLKPRTPKRCN